MAARLRPCIMSAISLLTVGLIAAGSLPLRPSSSASTRLFDPDCEEPSDDEPWKWPLDRSGRRRGSSRVSDDDDDAGAFGVDDDNDDVDDEEEVMVALGKGEEMEEEMDAFGELWAELDETSLSRERMREVEGDVECAREITGDVVEGVRPPPRGLTREDEDEEAVDTDEADDPNPSPSPLPLSFSLSLSEVSNEETGGRRMTLPPLPPPLADDPPWRVLAMSLRVDGVF